MSLPPTLGSAGLPAHLQRIGTGLRADVHRHSIELSTGRASDPARHLRGDIGALAVIETRLHRIGAQELALKSAGNMADTAQEALGRLRTAGETIRDRLVLVASGEATDTALTRTGQMARVELSAMISALSSQAAGRAAFSGIASDRGPLPDADTLMAAVGTHLAGAQTPADILAGIDDFFDAPGGPFATAIYGGGPPVSPTALLPDMPLVPLPTAADPAIRGALREAVLASLLAEPSIVPDLAGRRQLARLATERYPAASEALVGLRAQVGETQAMLETRRDQILAERDALIRSRDDLIGVDPFAAASRLEEARARLESLYVVTARIARLSLTEYLR